VKQAVRFDAKDLNGTKRGFGLGFASRGGNMLLSINAATPRIKIERSKKDPLTIVPSLATY
jgi:hypothetical protein